MGCNLPTCRAESSIECDGCPHNFVVAKKVTTTEQTVKAELDAPIDLGITDEVPSKKSEFHVYQNGIGSDIYPTIDKAVKALTDNIKSGFSLTEIDPETEEETEYRIDVKVTVTKKE